MYFELYQGTLYSGLTLNRNCQFNGRYLESVHQTLINALNDHKRTFLFHACGIQSTGVLVEMVLSVGLSGHSKPRLKPIYRVSVEKEGFRIRLEFVMSGFEK